MVKKSHDELEKLKREILAMGSLARDMLSTSIESLKELDEKKANWVISKKKELAGYDEKIEEKALRYIALYQPMAQDMRTIACILKMITSLTRIGRYGKDIANITKELAGKPHIKKLVSLPQMNKIVCDMIDDALKAFETKDVELLASLHARDDEVDELRHSIFRECLTYMMEDSKNITHCIHYTMIARYLERCGDHACEMGEMVHYMVTGERIEIK